MKSAEVPPNECPSGPSSRVQMAPATAAAFAGCHSKDRDNLREADAIVRRIDPANPCRAAVAAAREVICLPVTISKITKDLPWRRLSLAARWPFLRQAQAREFVVRSVYICLDNPERSIQGVRERVARGGQAGPAALQRKRREAEIFVRTT